MYLPGSIHLW